MEISAAQVKQLREKTGAGPMECKKALADCEGDFDKAEKLLKEKGLAAIEKRAGRTANEGKIFVETVKKEGGSLGVILELSSETDFVARNPEFIALGKTIANRILEKEYVEPNEELNGMVIDLAAKIRENMALKRLKLYRAGPQAILSSYIHGDGNIGVVAILAADKAEALEHEEVKTLAFNLALHVAAFNPHALDRSGIDPAYIQEQEELFKKQMEQDEKLQDKPEKVIQGVLQGKINKHLKDICLLEQGFVKEEKLTVAQVLADCGKQVGAILSVTDFGYFKVGG